mmetsp:Transcript_62510/g.163790  ORF Transcript_62510/g.163790 Transcript_62510/m.163790 type:complete len:392 (-) Transcript_62510:1200-2375(-)
MESSLLQGLGQLGCVQQRLQLTDQLLYLLLAHGLQLRLRQLDSVHSDVREGDIGQCFCLRTTLGTRVHRRLGIRRLGRRRSRRRGRGGLLVDPDAVLLALAALLPIAAVGVARMPGPEGHAQGRRAADLRHVRVRICTDDIHRCVDWNARFTPHSQQVSDLVPDMFSPVHDVIPEERRDARMCADVRIADHHLVVREGPMPLRAARVVVVDEGHSVLGHPTDKPRRLAAGVLQTPILAILAGLLEDTFRRKVEGRRLLVGGIDPVGHILSVPVLVSGKAVVVVLHVAPQLPDGPGGRALLAVEAHVLRGVALDEVETPAVEAHLQLQPAQPDCDGLLHLLVCVVDVWCRVELSVVLAGSVLASAVGVGVAQCDGPTAPIHDPGETGSVLHA